MSIARSLLVLTPALLVSCGANPEPADGVLIGVEPIDRQLSICVGVDWRDESPEMYWWTEGAGGCLTSSSSIVAAEGTIEDDPVRSSRRVRFSVQVIPDGTREIRFSVVPRGDGYNFVTGDGRVVPTEHRGDLDVPERPRFGP